MLGLIKGVSLKAWAYIALAFSFIGLLYKVYEAGGDAVKVKGMEKTLYAIDERDENEIYVDTLSDDSVDKLLRDNGWTRD